MARPNLRASSRVSALVALAERKAQKLELLARGAEQEIALVALLLAGAVERAAAAGERPRGDVMAGGQHLGAELARGDRGDRGT